MSSTTNLCISSCAEFVGRSQKPKKLNSASPSFSSSAYSSTTLSFSRSFRFTSAGQNRPPPSFPMATPISVKVNVSSTVEGVPDNKLEASSTGTVGSTDLLIVGPGVLGRIVAEEWRKEYPGSQIHGQTLTSDHHDELIKMGFSPSPKGTQLTHKFPYVIFCAPPYGNPDYPGEVREATLNWNGEGSFLFTSSSAPYDCSDNGSCDEDTPVVPIGRSPRTDNLLKAEKVALEAGGCVVRLAGLYISLLNLTRILSIRLDFPIMGMSYITTTLTCSTKQIEVPIHTGWRKGLSIFGQITSLI